MAESSASPSPIDSGEHPSLGSLLKHRLKRFLRDAWKPLLLILLTMGVVLSIYAVTADKFAWHTYFELAVPAAVLLMEVYVILRMVQESRQRTRTISELQEITSRSRRVEYLLDLAQSVHDTKSLALFTTATMEVSTKSNGQKEILEAVVRREKKGTYVHKGLIARRRNTLPGAIELMMRTKVQTRMSNAVAMSRLRFFVRDSEVSILGVAEGSPDISDPKKTTQSTRIESRMLAEALHEHFKTLWDQAQPVAVLLDEMIQSAMPVGRDEVMAWLSAIKCGPGELDTFLEKESGSDLYRTLPRHRSTAFGDPNVQEAEENRPADPTGGGEV